MAGDPNDLGPVEFKFPESPGTLNDDGPVAVPDFPAAIPFGLLEYKHPEYNSLRWSILRYLYAGGRQVFEDCKSDHGKAMLSKLFPQHRDEDPDVYEERLRRAFYIPYPGEILDFIVAGLGLDPVKLDIGEDEEFDEFWEGFFDDCSKPGGERVSLQAHLVDQVLTALICKRAWTLVDFPPAPDGGGEPMTVAQAEQLGLRDGYAIAVEPESVFDWICDEDGELELVNICVESNERPNIMQSRRWITRTYTLWTREAWARYRVTYDRNKPPKDKQLIEQIDQGFHSFERVPLIRLELNDSLWAMAKLEGMAIEHLNKRCAQAWAEYKSLFQERYEFEGDVDPMAGAPAIADDEGRTWNQTHGIGWTQHRYAQDRVEFVGASPEPFKYVLDALKDLRDEMHRVTYQMALAQENSAAVLGQSADSKKENRMASVVVLQALGRYLREHARKMVETMAKGRGEEHEWNAAGASQFSVEDLDELLGDAERVAVIDIPSPTFHQKHTSRLARAILGDEASPEEMDKIETELKAAFTEEMFQAPPDITIEAGSKTVINRGEPPEPEIVAPPPGAPGGGGARGFTSKPKPSAP